MEDDDILEGEGKGKSCMTGTYLQAKGSLLVRTGTVPSRHESPCSIGPKILCHVI